SRKLQFLTEYFREFFKRQFDFNNVLAGGVTRLPGAVLWIATERGSGFAFTLSYAAGVLRPVLKVRDFNRRHRNRHEVLFALADHLALGNVLLEVRLDSSL